MAEKYKKKKLNKWRYTNTNQNLRRHFLIETDKLILKFLWKDRRPKVDKRIKKKKKAEELTLPNFKTYHKGTVIKTI